MDDRERLRKSVEKEISDYDEFLAKMRELTDVSATVYDFREDAIAKITVIDNLPSDYFDKSAPRLFQLQDDNDRLRSRYLLFFPVLTSRTLPS